MLWKDRQLLCPGKLSFTSHKCSELFKNAGEKVLKGYNEASNNYFVDRANSGKHLLKKVLLIATLHHGFLQKTASICY